MNNVPLVAVRAAVAVCVVAAVLLLTVPAAAFLT